MMFDDWEIDHVDFVSTLNDVETRALRVIINALNTVNGDGRKRLVDAATEFFELGEET